MIRWQKFGKLEDKIASLLVLNLERFLNPINEIFIVEKVPYSGIIISSNSDIASGEKIENACYNKGGFVFLHKDYAKIENTKIEFPTSELIEMIQKVSKLYCKEIDKSFKKITVDTCWAVCQREGDYGTLHNHVSPRKHKGKLYSGMIYLRVPNGIRPETFPDGCLHLIGKNDIIYIPPIPNSIAIWPSNLVHGIHPFRGNGDRLGIAFNFIAE